MRFISIMRNPALDGIAECNVLRRWFYSTIRVDVPEATAFEWLLLKKNPSCTTF